MKIENRGNWMFWAIVALALMNISTLITIFLHTRKIDAGISRGTGPVITENAPVRYSGRYFRDALNLDRTQMEKFSGFNPVFRQRAVSINLELSRLKKEMLAEMSDQFPDTVRLNQLSDSVGFFHSELKKASYMYYLDFKAICDEQQNIKLKQLFSEIFEMNVQPGRYGRNGSRGRGPRWNYDN
jgi:hypothetical protein